MNNHALQPPAFNAGVTQLRPSSGMKRQGFTLGIQFNRQFGFLEIFSFFAEGVGAVLYIVGALLGLLPVAALGAFFVFLAVIALLSHLGTPLRAWRATTNAYRSMTSRGTIAISGFLAASAIWLFMAFMEFHWAVRYVFFGASLLLAIPVVFYAGFLLRSVRAIGLWRGPYLPLAFGAQALASALVVFVLVAHLDPATTGIKLWLGVAILSLLLCAVISLIHLGAVRRTKGVDASLDRMFRGDLRASFYWGGWLLGIIVPLAVFCLLYFGGLRDGGDSLWLLLVAAALGRLIGDYAYRRVIVLAGAYESIIG